MLAVGLSDEEFEEFAWQYDVLLTKKNLSVLS